jgi:HSP20 family molecular chaperone IbpA
MSTLLNDPLIFTLESLFKPSSKINEIQTHIRKNETEYVILIGVPGLSKNHFKIFTKEGTIKIIYEKDKSSHDNPFIDSFTKTFVIPDDVKESDIVGVVEDGILKITLPIQKKKTLERQISLN